MVNLKPAKQDHQQITLNRHSSKRQQLFIMILVSILLHGLGLLLLVNYQRDKWVGSEKANLKPIEFTVIPEEPDETITESGVNENPPPEPEPEPESKIAPPPTPPEPNPTPVPEPQTVVPEPEPTPTPVPEPEPIEPPVENQAPVLSGADSATTPTPEPEVTPTPSTPETPEPDSVATNVPPQSEPVPIPETTTPEPPAASNGVSTSASDLLGGNYEKTLASSGDAFFSPEALTHEAVLDPQQLQALQGFDLEGYQRRLYEKVKRNWKPSFREKYSTWLTFNIEKNGQISQLQVVESSGSAEFDRIAVEAVNDAVPLEPLPADFPLEHLEFKYQFYLY